VKKNIKKNRGFTLIEILVVIGIIAILAAVVLIAINPARQFAQANDSQRSANLNAILNAVGQYVADNKGNFPPSIEGGLLVLTPAKSIGSEAGGIDLCKDLVPKYLPAFPTDPKSTHDGTAIEFLSTNCGTYTSGYTIASTTQNRIIVAAPSTQATSTPISITR